MELDWSFPKRVERNENGDYCWKYDLKQNHNSEPLWRMMLILLAVAVPIALIMLVMTWQYGALQAALWSLGFLLLTAGLPALLWKLLPPDPGFRMSETRIEAWPRGKGRNIHDFKDVRRVILERGVDRIRLREAFGALDVYVPREDYEFVREYILARVPEGTETTYQ